jgi:E3 SUMO-protein ligase PIAS1
LSDVLTKSLLLQDTPNTSSHLPSRVVGLLEPHVIGSRQSVGAGVPRQTGGGNAYISMSVLNELMLQNRVNHAQAARGQTSSAAHARPTQANIQSHASRPQTLPQAPIPEAVPTVVQSTHLAGASDSIPELPVDENWHPTGHR